MTNMIDQFETHDFGHMHFNVRYDKQTKDMLVCFSYGRKSERCLVHKDVPQFIYDAFKNIPAENALDFYTKNIKDVYHYELSPTTKKI